MKLLLGRLPACRAKTPSHDGNDPSGFYERAGRHWPADLPYLLPKGRQEEQRLDYQHHLLTQALGGLTFAPVQELLRRGGTVLDVFVQGNLLEGLSFMDGQFTYTHQRLLAAAIPLQRMKGESMPNQKGRPRPSVRGPGLREKHWRVLTAARHYKPIRIVAIARELGLRRNTVACYLQEIYDELGVHSLREAITHAPWHQCPSEWLASSPEGITGNVLGTGEAKREEDHATLS